MTHEVKVAPSWYNDAIKGIKTFTVRKDDRDPKYKVGDMLRKREYSAEFGYTGRGAYFEIIYKLSDIDVLGIERGYCILGIRLHSYWETDRNGG
jgi:hypothetical protein